MKTIKQIEEYLTDKYFSMIDAGRIIGYLEALDHSALSIRIPISSNPDTLFETFKEWYHSPNCKYKIGDWVTVTHSGYTYRDYSKMYEKMGFPNGAETRVSDIKYGKIFNIALHPASNKILYGIEFDGGQTLIEEDGIKSYAYGDSEFYVITNNVSSWIENTEKYSINKHDNYLTEDNSNLSPVANVKEIRPATKEERIKLISQVLLQEEKLYYPQINDWIKV